jgi:ubiquinone/menaquinone biosynthesis C-methylase UbiE
VPTPNEHDTKPSAASVATTPDASYVEQKKAHQWLAGMDRIPEVTQYKEMSYELLQLHSGSVALELGCGLGDDAARLLPLVQPGGSVIGIDTSSKMVAEARTRHAGLLSSEESLTEPGRLSFMVASAEGILLPDRSCDAVRVDRVLQHVSDPLIVLREVKRVLRPDGRVVVIEPDWRSMAIHPGSPNGGDDDHVFEAVLQWQVQHTRHPLIGRQLRARLTQANFSDIQVLPVAYSSSSFAVASYVLELATAGKSATQGQSSLITPEDLERWFRAAEQAEKACEFYMMAVLYFAVGRKDRKESYFRG